MGFPVYPLSWDGSPGYREGGYFPEAVINFLAMLGWNPGTEEEIFNLEELTAAFTLERVHKSGARFDPEKTKWYNHQYLQKKSASELARLFRPILESRLEQQQAQTGQAQYIPEQFYIEKSVALLKERVTFVAEFWEAGSYFYIPPTAFSGKAVSKHWKPGTPDILNALDSFLQTIDDFASQNLERVIKKWIEMEGISFGKVMAPLRLVLVGDLMGPHLFDIMELLGKDACIERMRFALEQLDGKVK
jgi:glutamyl-tRNA synthetase